MRFCFVLFFVVFFVSGCSAIKNNVALSEPEDGPRSRVRVAMPKYGNGRNALVYPDSACVAKRITGRGRVLSNYTVSFEETLNNKKIGMAKTSISESDNYIKSEVYVRAGVPVIFQTFKVPSESISGVTSVPGTSISYISSTIYNDGCSNSITFVTEENVDYEVVFGPDFVSCSATVNKIVEDGPGVTLIPVQFGRPDVCVKQPRKK